MYKDNIMEELIASIILMSHEYERIEYCTVI